MIPGLVDHLWQSTLFVGAAWLLTLTLRKNQAQVRYWVWFTASVKFLIPFSLLVGLGTLAPRRAAAPPIQAQWVAIVEQISEAPIAIPSGPAATKRANYNFAAMAAVILWACGFASIAICWLVRWRRVHALRRLANRVDTLEFAVPVMSAPGLVEPGIVGVFRPVLLLPEGIWERLDRAQMDAILAHELCHVRRRDNLTATIHMAVQAIFWFHPPVWWLGARLVDERERACDEEVLQIFGQPKAYAEGILNVCKLYVESRLACVSGVTGSNLKKRIEAIMKNRMVLRLNSAKKAALAVAGIATLAVPIVVGMMNAPYIQAQSAPARTPRFEVASIKPCEPGQGPSGYRVAPGRFRVVCLSVAAVIGTAYVTNADAVSGTVFARDAIIGGPAWISSAQYDIEAKAEGNPTGPIMGGPMLRALLEDRFKLKLHRETKEIPVYELTVAKSGFKLKPLKEGSCTPFTPLTPAPPGLTQEEARAAAAQRCNGQRGFSGNGVEYHAATLDQMAATLTHLIGVDRPVINRTGIAGIFDYHLVFTPDETTPRGAFEGDSPAQPRPDGAAGPSIFTAIQEQLGLKLEPAKGAGEFLVIDSVVRPSEN
jgi:bla regulator protein BlaR1